MEKVNLNKLKGAKFCFNFQILEKLQWPKDMLNVNDNESEIRVITDTDFSLKNLKESDFMDFFDEFKNSSDGQSISCMDYKKEYVYENDVFTFNAIGSFVKALQFADLDWESEKQDFTVDLTSDMILLKIKDIKKFMKKYNVNLGIERKNPYFCS